MSTKTFCDRCGDEAVVPYRAIIVCGPPIEAEESRWEGDLCRQCAGELGRWVKEYVRESAA